MNQAEVNKLVSQLRFAVRSRHRKLKNPRGAEGRIDKLRKTVTGLIKNERIELNKERADEARQYAERLISDALRYGDTHRPTMEMASFWLLEKQLVHKLFKVLVPRLENCTTSYTRMYKAPREYPGNYFKRAVLEIRGNPFPPLHPQQVNRKGLLHNILLEEARKANLKEAIEKLANVDLAEKSEQSVESLKELAAPVSDESNKQ